MILNSLASIVSFFLTNLFKLFSIPTIPEEVRTAIYDFFDLIFENLSLLGLFIDISLLKKLCAMVIVCFSFEKVFVFFRYLYNKLPFINV